MRYLEILTLVLLCASFGCDDDDAGDTPAPDAAVEADAGADASAGPDVGPDDAAQLDAELDAATDAALDEGVDDDAALAPDAAYEHDPNLVTLNGPCPAATRFGGFKVESNDADGYTAIDGVVKDRVVPGQVPEESNAEGGCRLLRRRRLTCEPTCEPGHTCDIGGICVPMPLGQDMGEVVFHGLVQPVSLEALQPGNSYFFTRLPHPGFEPSTVIHIENTPGFMGPLDLYGVGVAPLVPVEDTWVLTEGEALTVHWAAPPAGSPSHIYFELNIDQHGLTPVNLVCELPDTGEAVVPVVMTDALIAAGVTGYPTGRVARRTADSVSFDERCVDFVVSSVRPIAIEVTDHQPCTVHEDCPSGLCDLVIQQCE